MAALTPESVPVGPDTLVTVKVIIDGTNRRFKLALRDLGAHVLPQKLRFLLAVPPDADVVLERFSDSAGSFVALDSNDPAIYKQLYRAAKAKLKLRIKATIVSQTSVTNYVPNIMDEQQQLPGSLRLPMPPKVSPAPRHSYLETVLSGPREEEDQILKSEIPARIAGSRVVPEDPRSLLSHNNATSETLVTPAMIEQTTPATVETPRKSTPPSSVSVAHGQQEVVGAFCIDCNSCGKSIPNEHYHCGTCDNSDFDLCLPCIEAHVTCEGEGHWLIKRRIQNGLVISSVTETIAPRKSKHEQSVANDTGKRITLTYPTRTCNSCINECPGEGMVTCANCGNYDLCMICFSLGDHGHHPGHRFQPVSADTSKISSRILSLCEPGRSLAHAANCDGCDKHIFGVRHKCLSCPDWDYCASCVQSAPQIHAGHRFAALYEPISDLSARDEVHFGIYCDGPLCSSRSYKQYIHGTRYKCAVCHDTDFCANCEAVPSLCHNRTHPLLKFQTPVRHVSVTTLEEKHEGQSTAQMGDRPRARNAATETTPVSSSISTASQVHTVAEVRPEEVPVAAKAQDSTQSKPVTSELRAWFSCDSTPDGTKVIADGLFTQSWTMYNPGPHAWPAGCAVHFTGGAHMLKVDTKNPSSVMAMAAATRSNVVGAPVEAGQPAVFTVLLKSPEREGRAISYWRLKTPDAIPFGHKLWVDITVASAAGEVEGEQKQEAVEAGKEEAKTEESSTMIFPKLEKESPMSSIGDLAGTRRAVRSSGKVDIQDLMEDVESLDFEDGDETDDGFLTDEEYDMLDASDEDVLKEAHNAVAT